MPPNTEDDMFQRTFYTLQAKKALWFAAFATLATYTLMATTLTPILLYGLLAGITAFHLLPLVPPIITGVLIAFSPLLILFTPIALGYNLAFIGLMANALLLGNEKMLQALKHTHAMGAQEKEDHELMQKLEKKTKITVKNKEICEVDESFAPNAAAVGGFSEQKIYVFSNILKAPFTRKEKKAVYAHEFGHLKHKDFLAESASRFLYWTTAVFALSAFSLPVALLFVFAANIAYYAISQINELLADWHCAQYANPKALGSALDKIIDSAEKIKANESKKEKGLLDTPKSYLNSFKRKVGMHSHPSVAVRKSYLDTYDTEKQLLKKSKAHRPHPTAAAA